MIWIAAHEEKNVNLKTFNQGILAMLMMGFAAMSCSAPSHAGELPVPAEDIERTEETEMRTAVLAAGCFWCVEAVYQQLDGVSEVVSGYAGGTEETANYRAVSGGRTDHAEVVQVTYDASKLTYGQLLRVYFATHDPTTLNRQGPDQGRQYRSAIFYANEDEKRVAEGYIKQLEEAKAFSRPIVTTLEPLEAFYPAEEYHQDFMDRNPLHPYIQQWAVPKVEKVQKQFPEKVKAGD
jgi:peptide-methionine (S)-S-oxide reductase